MSLVVTVLKSLFCLLMAGLCFAAAARGGLPCLTHACRPLLALGQEVGAGPQQREPLLGVLILAVFIGAGLVWLRDAWASLQPRSSSVESDFGP